MKVLQKWDPSLKIPALFLLMMSMAFIRNQQIIFLLPCIAVSMLLASDVSFKFLLPRLRAPVLLLLLVALFMMLFSEGSTVFSIGPAHFKLQGSIQALNLVLRVLSIISIGIVLVHTTPLSGLSSKLKKMMIPPLLVDIGVMTGRYIIVIGEEYGKMKNSRRLRGYSKGKSISHLFRVVVPTAATLLIRGFDQSEMVFNAMHMRGYGSTTPESNSEKPSSFSIAMFLLIVTLSITLITLEISLES